ncbi:MAG: PEP-utilizing enzyme [Streptosporangiaceae bacterium]
MADRLPSPFDIATPPGAAGWRELYSYSMLFSGDRRDYEDSMFWFVDGVHAPEVLCPWDATVLEFAFTALSQYNTRHYLVPPALGVDFRILNGYLYLSPVGVTDPAEIEARVPHFTERAGHYFRHWDEFYASWMGKVGVLIGGLEDIRFGRLPDTEDLAVITGGLGLGSGFDLITQYNRLIELTLKLWNYHFEFLNLGYVAYLDFFRFCKQIFPSLADQAIAKMVAGIEVDLFKPDEELKKLALLAVELGLDDAFDRAPGEVLKAVADRPGGARWLDAWARAQQPWFNFSAGSGFYHTDKVWAENQDIPLGFILSYIAKVRRGERLERPVDAIAAERERIVSDVTELIGTDEDRAMFQAKLELARTVFPYVENHNFYVEHWAQSVIWRKMRELGGIFVTAGFFSDPDDVFLLGRDEIPGALFDLYHGWAVGVPPRGPRYWPPEIRRRRAVIDSLRAWSPPPALGVPPEDVTEPFTVMLWGITSDAIRQWAGGAEADGGLTGFAASPGVAEGPARVISSAAGIGELRDGEILVAPLTAPSWAPVFGKIAATVTDVGGIMSHAAIVCREYGLPAVTGTAFGTKIIKTGQRIRVDGNTGTVTVLRGSGPDVVE